MNILILTARFGLGHIKTAEAIKEDLLINGKISNQDVNVEIVDLMGYLFPKSSEMIYTGFNFMVSKCSGLYNLLNKVAGKKGEAPLKIAIARKIDKLLETYDADAIVVVFPVCSQYISAYKKIRQSKIPMYTYITDITAHEEWIASGTDLYFVGDSSTKNTLMSKGILESDIAISGIPVRNKFKAATKSSEQEDLPLNKEILLLGGGLGLLPCCNKMLAEFSKDTSVHFTVITGTNHKLYEKLKTQFPWVNVVGYTDKIDEYMRRADLIVSKAGGITTFEAIYSGTPMYVIKPFLEQELGNARFIEEHNIGRVIWSDEIDIKADILELLFNDVLLDKISENMRALRSSYDNTDLLSIIGNRGLKECS